MEWGALDDVDGKLDPGAAGQELYESRGGREDRLESRHGARRGPAPQHRKRLLRGSLSRSGAISTASHSGERVFYIVAEKGQHDLGGLMVEAGTVFTGALFNAGAWENVALTAPFVGIPGVFASVQTRESDTTPVTTRILNHRTVRRFPGRDAGRRGQHRGRQGGRERGMDRGGDGNRLDRRAGAMIEILTGTADDEFSTTQFTPSTARAFRTVVAEHGERIARMEHPATVRHANLGRDQIDLLVQEEQSKDDEMGHPDRGGLSVRRRVGATVSRGTGPGEGPEGGRIFDPSPLFFCLSGWAGLPDSPRVTPEKAVMDMRTSRYAYS